ncbi:LOW QUALITY PROTEIN: hypothetical protein KUTeg_010282 [Tegillarca granosa]|uniref:HAT C-terminal dimerisation domain-containing protein n=1 Tax=Tegillarca granosa TaxID=220873 RepID=A0ABQ9F699_TEGGR|nr:LOW QUALITY PROTEIN: hypothetical protein KUTeg_010282 [Tegillarca granosa]
MVKRKPTDDLENLAKSPKLSSFGFNTPTKRHGSLTVHGINSHARSIEICKQSSTMDAAREAALSKNKHTIVSALRNVYFAACATQLKDLAVDSHTSYKHNQSIHEFQSAISLVDKLLAKIEASNEFSIMIDESTDVSVHQKLLVFIRIVEEVGARWEPTSYFLGIRHFSPKHMAAPDSIQAVIVGADQCRFKQVFATRWLSFEGSVSAVVKNYSALLSVFLQENSAKALSLYKPVSSFKFLYCAHFLADVLKQLCILNKMYQKSDLDFSQLDPLLCSTITVLEGLRDSKSGSVLSELVSAVPAEPTLDSDGLFTFEFQGHTIRDGIKQRQEAVESLRARFSNSEDAEVMSAMCSVLDPGSLGEQVSSDDIATVIKYLNCCSISDSSSFEQELTSFRSYVQVQVTKKSEGVKTVTDVAQLGVRLMDFYPVVGVVCKRVLLLPVSTVDCERGFSKQNLIKSCTRNRLQQKTLENLMRISIDGPREIIDYDLVFKSWVGVKQRRIMK